MITPTAFREDSARTSARDGFRAAGHHGVVFLKSRVPMRTGELARSIAFAPTTDGVTWFVTGRPALYYRKVAGDRVGREMEAWIGAVGRIIVDDAVVEAIREEISR